MDLKEEVRRRIADLTRESGCHQGRGQPVGQEQGKLADAARHVERMEYVLASIDDPDRLAHVEDEVRHRSGHFEVCLKLTG